MLTLAEILFKLRVTKGLSQKSIADTLGVSTGFVSRSKTGRPQEQSLVIQKIVRAFPDFDITCPPGALTLFEDVIPEQVPAKTYKAHGYGISLKYVPIISISERDNILDHINSNFEGLDMFPVSSNYLIYTKPDYFILEAGGAEARVTDKMFIADDKLLCYPLPQSAWGIASGWALITIKGSDSTIVNITDETLKIIKGEKFEAFYGPEVRPFNNLPIQSIYKIESLIYRKS